MLGRFDRVKFFKAMTLYFTLFKTTTLGDPSSSVCVSFDYIGKGDGQKLFH